MLALAWLFGRNRGHGVRICPQNYDDLSSWPRLRRLPRRHFGTAATESRCQTTFAPPTETSVAHYDRLNYKVAIGALAQNLLSCTQHSKPTRKERAFGALIGATPLASCDRPDQPLTPFRPAT